MASVLVLDEGPQARQRTEGTTYLKRYADQKASTARTCNLRDLTDGRPRTWSIMMCED